MLVCTFSRCPTKNITQHLLRFFRGPGELCITKNDQKTTLLQPTTPSPLSLPKYWVLVFSSSDPRIESFHFPMLRRVFYNHHHSSFAPSFPSFFVSFPPCFSCVLFRSSPVQLHVPAVTIHMPRQHAVIIFLFGVERGLCAGRSGGVWLAGSSGARRMWRQQTLIRILKQAHCIHSSNVRHLLILICILLFVCHANQCMSDR